MKVVITGAGGRLGAALTLHLRARHHVVAYDRTAMNLLTPEQIEDHLAGLEFEVLVNCAALTSLDHCETHPDEAHQVNSAAPAQMARICRDRSARMIHISTNYVYDGTLPGLRLETDPAVPLGAYARTKLDGELGVLRAWDRHIVTRTAWIFGPHRESFVDHIIKRAQKEDNCAAIDDTWSSASYSHDMAKQLERLMENSSAAGLYNLSNAGACSWLELGQAALDHAAKLGWRLRSRTLQSQSLADMKSFLAPRPVHTAMDVSKLAAATGLRPRHWKEALHDYLSTYYIR